MNKYLEKVAITRLVKEIAKGTVSKPLEHLLRAGALRSPGQYAAGMRKGTNEIVSRAGATISKPRSSSLLEGQSVYTGGYMAAASRDGKIRILNNRKSSAFKEMPYSLNGTHQKQLGNLMHQSALRHEAFEAQSVRRALNSGASLNLEKGDSVKQALSDSLERARAPVKSGYHMKREVGGLGFPKINAQLQHGGVPVGSHHSLRVLGQESEMIRKNPYLKNSPLSEARSFTGENKFISKLTGRRFGQDRMSGKDLKKLDKASPHAENEHGHLYHIG